MQGVDVSVTKHKISPQAGPVWELGRPNKLGVRPMILRFEKKPERHHELPRYVQTRLLKSGRIAYYWCPPHWARKNGFPLLAEALGHDLDKAMGRIVKLNAYLDRWRIVRKAKSKYGCFVQME